MKSGSAVLSRLLKLECYSVPWDELVACPCWTLPLALRQLGIGDPTWRWMDVLQSYYPSVLTGNVIKRVPFMCVHGDKKGKKQNRKCVNWAFDAINPWFEQTFHQAFGQKLSETSSSQLGRSRDCDILLWKLAVGVGSIAVGRLAACHLLQNRCWNQLGGPAHLCMFRRHWAEAKASVQTNLLLLFNVSCHICLE